MLEETPCVLLWDNREGANEVRVLPSQDSSCENSNSLERSDYNECLGRSSSEHICEELSLLGELKWEDPP